MAKACPTCGLTRWESRQVDGWLDSMRAEIDHLRAGIQWARGMCTDEAPHVEIDQALARTLDPERP